MRRCVQTFDWYCIQKILFLLSKYVFNEELKVNRCQTRQKHCSICKHSGRNWSDVLGIGVSAGYLAQFSLAVTH